MISNFYRINLLKYELFLLGYKFKFEEVNLIIEKLGDTELFIIDWEIKKLEEKVFKLEDCL